MTAPFSSVGIVGLGLMGGSLARALKDSPGGPSVSGLTNSQEDLEAALIAGVLDRGTQDPDGFFTDLDLVVYCTPPSVTLGLLSDHQGLLPPDCVLTDVVSLKGPILLAARKVGLGPRFVGSHPMTGGESSGFHSGRADLYRGAPVWICPGEVSGETVAKVEAFWTVLGAAPKRIGADQHDVLMTWASHLPQAVSTALSAALQKGGVERTDLGPGGRDLTRLAGSDPHLWVDLFRQAPDSLVNALGAAEETLRSLRQAIEEGQFDELREVMETNRRWYKRES